MPKKKKVEEQEITVGEPENLTRVQKKKAEHEKKAQERAEQQNLLKAEYLKIKESPAFVDLMGKVSKFIEYHAKVAKDGVGFKDQRMPDGSVKQELVRLSPEERVSELDRAAGQQEIADYLDRQISEVVS